MVGNFQPSGGTQRSFSVFCCEQKLYCNMVDVIDLLMIAALHYIGCTTIDEIVLHLKFQNKKTLRTGCLRN